MIEAHCGTAPVPSRWLDRWNADPALLAGLTGSGLLHVVLMAVLGRRLLQGAPVDDRVR